VALVPDESIPFRGARRVAKSPILQERLPPRRRNVRVGYAGGAGMPQNRGVTRGESMPITELNHYLLVAKDLERTRDFYENVLGLELAERPDFGFPGYWLKTGDHICVHLASQEPNKTRDMFLLKKHPEGTRGSGSVDHIAFLARDPDEVRGRIQKNKIEMHFRSFPDAKLFQIFLRDPDDVTIELNFLGEVIDPKKWEGKGSASAVTLEAPGGKARRQN
jgi:catechol 2,3-dioxygenase-like lactoylglutathione lyase family enzyme